MASRIFDETRSAQGFRSQEHLDAFYHYFDHTQSCPQCQQAGPVYYYDDGYQPTQQRCAEAQRLAELF